MRTFVARRCARGRAIRARRAVRFGQGGVGFSNVVRAGRAGAIGRKWPWRGCRGGGAAARRDFLLGVRVRGGNNTRAER